MLVPSSKVLRESSAVDSPGSLVGWLGWERAPTAQEPQPGSCASKGRPETVAPAWVS
jgi:hypothetical protein